ncbi:MAG: hypothetical protein R2761_09095 [Acidimicrobiales bacterium]
MATLGSIDDPLIATAVAGVVSASACAALLAAAGRFAPQLPTIAVGVAAATVAVPLVDVPPSRFLNGEAWAYPAATVAGLGAGLALFAISAFRARCDPERRRWATVGLAALSMGAFLCIPETGLLRIVPGPLCVVALAAMLGRARPFDPLSTALVAGLISWLGITGGTGRPSSVLGVACGLGLGAIGSAPPVIRVARRAGVVGLISVAAVIVLGARAAGTVSSSAAALSMTWAAVLLGAASLAAGRARSEELQSPQRQ